MDWQEQHQLRLAFRQAVDAAREKTTSYSGSQWLSGRSRSLWSLLVEPVGKKAVPSEDVDLALELLRPGPLGRLANHLSYKPIEVEELHRLYDVVIAAESLVRAYRPTQKPDGETLQVGKAQLIAAIVRSRPKVSAERLTSFAKALSQPQYDPTIRSALASILTKAKAECRSDPRVFATLASAFLTSGVMARSHKGRLAAVRLCLTSLELARAAHTSKALVPESMPELTKMGSELNFEISQLARKLSAREANELRMRLVLSVGFASPGLLIDLSKGERANPAFRGTLLMGAILASYCAKSPRPPQEMPPEILAVVRLFNKDTADARSIYDNILHDALAATETPERDHGKNAAQALQELALPVHDLRDPQAASAMEALALSLLPVFGNAIVQPALKMQGLLRDAPGTVRLLRAVRERYDAGDDIKLDFLVSESVCATAFHERRMAPAALLQVADLLFRSTGAGRPPMGGQITKAASLLLLTDGLERGDLQTIALVEQLQPRTGTQWAATTAIRAVALAALGRPDAARHLIATTEADNANDIERELSSGLAGSEWPYRDLAKALTDDLRQEIGGLADFALDRAIAYAATQSDRQMPVASSRVAEVAVLS